MDSLTSEHSRRWLLPVLVIVVVGLWQTPILMPLKLLIVFFHESSHALMTVLTGGKVEKMVIDSAQGGYVLSRGGNRFLILSAGYLGSLLWGVSIYLSALYSRRDSLIMGILGTVVIVIAILFVRSWFAFIFSMAVGVGMLLLAAQADHAANDLLLRVIGIVSMLYVPLDIYSDTLARSGLSSDARMLAETYGGATILWGGLWLLISLVVIFWVVRRKG